MQQGCAECVRDLPSLMLCACSAGQAGLGRADLRAPAAEVPAAEPAQGQRARAARQAAGRPAGRGREGQAGHSHQGHEPRRPGGRCQGDRRAEAPPGAPRARPQRLSACGGSQQRAALVEGVVWTPAVPGLIACAVWAAVGQSDLARHAPGPANGSQPLTLASTSDERPPSGAAALQETPDTAEALACVPSLALEDIPKRATTVPSEVTQVQGVTVLQHDLFTNDVLYAEAALDMHPVPAQLLPLVPLFCRCAAGLPGRLRPRLPCALLVARCRGRIWPVHHWCSCCVGFLLGPLQPCLAPHRRRPAARSIRVQEQHC